MEYSRRKKLKLNEYSYKVVHHKSSKEVEEKSSHADSNKKYNIVDNDKNKKIGFYEKLSKIYSNLNIFRKSNEEKEREDIKIRKKKKKTEIKMKDIKKTNVKGGIEGYTMNGITSNISCGKSNNIPCNLSHFLKEEECDIIKQRKKRTFEDISKDDNYVSKNKNEDIDNYRSPFEYQSLLKSLLYIYNFYTSKKDNSFIYNDNENCKNYISNIMCYKDDEVFNNNMYEDENEYYYNDEGYKKNIYKSNDLFNYKIKESESEYNHFNKIFINVVNDKSGFFFIFNTIYFTHLKNFYYFVDILNILNYIGKNKSIINSDEINKDICIYEKMAMFIEYTYDIFVSHNKRASSNDNISNNNNINSYNNNNNNNTNCSNTGLHLVHTKLLPCLKKEEHKETQIEYIRKELELLRSKKSYEELLFISMNECNKKIYNEINKIPELFFDMSEISDYTPNDIIISNDINKYTSYPLFNNMDDNLLNDNKQMKTHIGIYDKLKNKLSSFTSSRLEGKKKNSIGNNNSNRIFVFKSNSTENEYKKEENEMSSFNIQTDNLLKTNEDNTHISNNEHDDVMFVGNDTIPSNHNKNKKKESIKDFVFNLFKQRKVKNDDNEMSGRNDHYRIEEINNINNDMHNDIHKDIYNDNNYPMNENQMNKHLADEQKIDVLTNESIILNLNNEENTNKDNFLVDDNNKINDSSEDNEKEVDENKSFFKCDNEPALEHETTKEHNDLSHDELINNSDELSDEISDDISNDVSDDVSDNISDNVSDDVSDDISDNVSDNISDNVSDNISDNVSDNVSDYIQKETLKDPQKDIVSQHDSENKSNDQSNNISKEEEAMTINDSVSNAKTEESNVIENENLLNQVNKKDNLLGIYEKEQQNDDDEINEDIMENEKENVEVEKNENVEVEEKKNVEVDEKENMEVEEKKNVEVEEKKNVEVEEKKNVEVEEKKNVEVEEKKNVEVEEKKNVEMEEKEDIEVEEKKNVEVEEKKNVEVQDQNEGLKENEIIKLDEEESNKSDEKESVKSDEKESVKSGEEESIKSDDEQSIKSDDEQSIISDEKESIISDEEESVKLDDDQSIISDEDQTIKSDDDQTIKSDDDQSVKLDDDQSFISDEDNQSENSIEYESDESEDNKSDKSHKKKRKHSETLNETLNDTLNETYVVEENIEQHTCDNTCIESCKTRNCNRINDEEIINFLKSNDKNVYRKYLKNLLVCDKKCSIENHSEEKDLFLKRVQKLCSLIKNKKFNYKYTDYWKNKVHFKCCKLQRAYNIFIVIIFSIVKEIKNLTKELNEMNNFIFINSGIETYLNECNISLVQKRKEHNDIINNYFNENNIINSFFFKKNFCKEEEEEEKKKKKKKKYISYVPLHNYKILFLCLQDIFNDKNNHDKLEKISYYIEFDDTNILPNYCNSFYKNFKINEMYLYHIQSLYNDSVPTITCLNMLISCMNYNYSKIHKKKSLFKYELNNTHLSTLPYVYCCDIQLIKYFEFLKLKETCYKIIKNNKIYDNFLTHLSSYIFDDSYFIIPFFTSYGKFLIIIKTNKNIDNLQQSMDNLKNKNSITYDVIINSFVFPNDSSFQAIIHFSHIFINTLKNVFKTRNSDEDIPDITFENLLNVDKKRLIYHEIESSKNKRDIIINMIFLIESFFNNTEKTRIPKEFDEGLRFLYVIRLLEFFHHKKDHQC
ncbi:conserved Plasmodium protein, unknown function [Plasmodium sp. gorilla clade G2]|uniref:conserved Plasmodium protein, unknown function n=1 Tax=Plasmodium sp. gorilla clade G2 TaxID=880535 RepID=UPI000D209006|nr:conserved Plasmodium protein, unknown function [Plasmodium sp. gorilla clade G2]SOV17033.1 conserved Plasmodium protein, unknown function [Plasmodium sp. gorilla clade G2]